MRPAVQSISFVVVALNAEKTLPLLLDDLRCQTLPPDHLEIILVDSGSEDRTRSIMEAFQREAPFRRKMQRRSEQLRVAKAQTTRAAGWPAAATWPCRKPRGMH